MATYRTYSYKPKGSSYRDYLDYERPTSTYQARDYSDNGGAYAQEIARARAVLGGLKAPSAYQSQYTSQMDNILNTLNSRKFSYDVNKDAMFQSLKQLYNDQARSNMADAQGQAAALTGGYGNSYATAVGQQAAQSTQEQLADRIPELQQLALSRYQQEGTDLQNQYAMLSDRDTAEYGKYRDSVSDYQNERAYRDSVLQNLRSMNQNIWSQEEQNRYNANAMDWSNYHDAVNIALQQLQHDWNQYQWAEGQTQHNYEQAVSEDQWAAQLAENQRQYDASLAEQQAQRGENARQFNETMAYNKGKDEYEKKKTQLESDTRLANARKKIASRQTYNSDRRNYSNWYNSYEEYVEHQIDLNKELTDSERIALYNEFTKKK